MSANPEPVVSREEAAYIHREYTELRWALIEAIIPIHQMHASTDRYAVGAFDAQDRILKALQPMLLASSKRFGRLGREIATLEARQAIPLQVADAISRISGWQPRLYSIQDQPALDAIRTVVEFMVSIPSPQPDPLSMKQESIDTGVNNEPSYSRNPAESLMTNVGDTGTSVGDAVDA